MAYNLQNVDLSRYPFNVGLIFNLVFFEDFDCNFLASDEMRAKSHLSEGTLTE